MFYRIGGTSKAPNRQQDFVFADTVDMATDWLPVSKGDDVAVNIARAVLTFGTVADSLVTSSPIAPECQVILEQKMLGGPNPTVFPIDTWQNMVVATSRDIKAQGWVRLIIKNINNDGGASGLSMALQVNRTGVAGVAR